MNNTLRSLEILLLCLRRPPIDEVPLFVELSTLIVEAVSNFVADDEPDRAVIHVLWSIVIEERAFQNTSREFCETVIGCYLVYRRVRIPFAYN